MHQPVAGGGDDPGPATSSLARKPCMSTARRRASGRSPPPVCLRPWRWCPIIIRAARRMVGSGAGPPSPGDRPDDAMLIELENVSKAYGKVEALRGLSVALPEGA